MACHLSPYTSIYLTKEPTKFFSPTNRQLITHSLPTHPRPFYHPPTLLSLYAWYPSSILFLPHSLKITTACPSAFQVSSLKASYQLDPGRPRAAQYVPARPNSSCISCIRHIIFSITPTLLPPEDTEQRPSSLGHYLGRIVWHTAIEEVCKTFFRKNKGKLEEKEGTKNPALEIWVCLSFYREGSLFQ